MVFKLANRTEFMVERYAIKGSPGQKLLLEDIYYAIESRVRVRFVFSELIAFTHIWQRSVSLLPISSVWLEGEISFNIQPRVSSLTDNEINSTELREAQSFSKSMLRKGASAINGQREGFVLDRERQRRSTDRRPSGAEEKGTQVVESLGPCAAGG